MKNKIIIIIVFLSTTNLFAQKGKIIYKASIDTEFFRSIKNNEGTNQVLVNRTEKETKDVICDLLFNKNKSVFKRVEKLTTKESLFNITFFRVGESVFYYDNVTQITIEENNLSGELFLITKDKIKWKLANDTKKINGFECKKATAIVNFTNIDGQIKRKITAWYAPQIPLSFGPKNYNGLPGLILMLQEKELIYLALSIDLNSNNEIEIKPSKKGKKISQKQFDKIPWDY